jgi:hypothetical protein
MFFLAAPACSCGLPAPLPPVYLHSDVLTLLFQERHGKQRDATGAVVQHTSASSSHAPSDDCVSDSWLMAYITHRPAPYRDLPVHCWLMLTPITRQLWTKIASELGIESLRWTTDGEAERKEIRLQTGHANGGGMDQWMTLKKGLFLSASCCCKPALRAFGCSHSCGS